MTANDTLASLIAYLRKASTSTGMTSGVVQLARDRLVGLDSKYKYDLDRFPPLVDTHVFTDTSTDTPSNLAEALLWKLGKWNSYKQFAANYMADDPQPTKTNVVFFAFAKHLQDKGKYPIYDQHAIRALWAICGRFTYQENDPWDLCHSLLLDSKGTWKPSGSGSDTIECYHLFVKHINALVNIPNGVRLNEVDRLLMPLGQAIKKSTKSYTEFQRLCGWQVSP